MKSLLDHITIKPPALGQLYRNKQTGNLFTITYMNTDTREVYLESLSGSKIYTYELKLFKYYERAVKI